VIEEDAQRGGEGNGDEHAEDAGPAESRDEGHDDEDRWQPHRVAHDLGIDEVEDDVRDDEVRNRDQHGLDWGRRQTDEDRRHCADEGPDIRDQCGDAGDKAERHRICQSQYRARNATEDSDHPGDDQLTSDVRIEHLADSSPDLIEVGAIVAGNESAQDTLDGRCIEREQEGDDECEDQLQKGGQRGQADAHCVAKLAKEIFP